MCVKVFSRTSIIIQIHLVCKASGTGVFSGSGETVSAAALQPVTVAENFCTAGKSSLLNTQLREKELPSGIYITPSDLFLHTWCSLPCCNPYSSYSCPMFFKCLLDAAAIFYSHQMYLLKGETLEYFVHVLSLFSLLSPYAKK